MLKSVKKTYSFLFITNDTTSTPPKLRVTMSSDDEDTEDLCLVVTYIPVVFLILKGLVTVFVLTCLYTLLSDIKLVSCTALLIWFFDNNIRIQTKLERACGGVVFVVFGFLLHIMASSRDTVPLQATPTLNSSYSLQRVAQHSVDSDYIVIYLIDTLWACISLTLPFLPYHYTATAHAVFVYACCTVRFLVESHSPSGLSVMDLHLRVILFYASCAVIFFCRSSCRTYNYYTPVMVSVAVLVITAHVCIPMVVCLVAVHVMRMRARNKSNQGFHYSKQQYAYETLKNNDIEQPERTYSKTLSLASVAGTEASDTKKSDVDDGSLMQQLLAAKVAHGIT